jgi:nucleoid-associated protein YgaU
VIFKGSRYERVAAEAYVVDTPGGLRRALPPRLAPPTPGRMLHTVVAGDRLDLLAYRYFGDPLRFWLIADANDEVDPEDLLEPGRQIQIPSDRAG